MRRREVGDKMTRRRDKRGDERGFGQAEERDWEGSKKKISTEEQD